VNLRRLKPGASVLVAVAALMIGLEAPAMAHQVNVVAHRISGTSITEHSIAGNRLINNTLTGTQIKESTLGVVPLATKANTLPPLKWHEITPAQFQGFWANYSTVNESRRAAYAVDAQGIVHLRGAISGGTEGTTAFMLPAALLPAGGQIDVTDAVHSQGTGLLVIDSTNGVEPFDGASTPGDATVYTSLDGVTFSPGQ
jgi:hypothetical protein